MRFSEGGGADDPEPLQGHERVRGKEDGCADEVGGWGGVCVLGGWGGNHCLA